MKKGFILSLLLMVMSFMVTSVSAKTDETDPCGNTCLQQQRPRQGRHHFDPEKYQKDLEAYITKEAKLTQQEAQKFFPLLREMQKKQRELSKKQRDLYRNAASDEKAALKAIKSGDDYEIQIKKLQQQYHARFLKVLSATKVLKCIHAEEKFNRNMMKNMAK